MSDTQKQNQEFQSLIEKYLQGKLKMEELKSLVNYYESFQESHDWVEALGPENKIKQKMLINILENIQDQNQTRVLPIYKRPIFKYAAAAILVAMVGLAILFNPNMVLTKSEQVVEVETPITPGANKATLTLEDGTQVVLEAGKSFNSNHVHSDGSAITYDNASANSDKISGVKYNVITIPRKGQFTLKLSDGTQVWLNSETQIKYPVQFAKGQTRIVELIYGEAYFDVSPSKEHQGAGFNVLSGNQEVKVLGTEFNVKAYHDETAIYTTLVEGKISLDVKKQEELSQVLKPGEQFVLNKVNGKTDLKAVDVASQIAWKRGLFNFKNMSLAEITKVLSRWYDVNFAFDDDALKAVKFKGVLNKNQDIQDILNLFINTNYIKTYEINGNKITIKSE